MLDRLKKLISSTGADFADIRYERMTDTAVSFTGHDLKTVASCSSDGFVVRVLRGTGFSSATVTREEDVPKALRLASEGADLMRSTGGKEIRLAEVPVVVDTVKAKLNGDPREMSLEDKIALARKYNGLMLDQPEIASTGLAYMELSRDKHYVNSEGTAVSEELVTTSIAGEVIARRGGLLQNVRVAVGGSDGWARIQNRDDLFVERAVLAGRLLDATPVKAGTYNVILSPMLAGVFTHEAFGHFSEADCIEDNESLRGTMKLGVELGSSFVNIVADSPMPDQLGYYRYDDEGVAVRRVKLMDRGVLSGRLHSRATAAAFGEPVTGHAVAEDYRYEPLIRMGTIFIEPGAQSFDDLVKQLGDGLYLVDSKGGQTSGENFTFGAGHGFFVEGGAVGGMIRDINIMGNLFATLKGIAGVSRDFELSERGGCGKGQTNIKSALGGPHVLITDMVVGGV